MKTKVVIKEYEIGWGNTIDEVKEFDTLEEANEFCWDFNSKNNLLNVPNWYITAEII